MAESESAATTVEDEAATVEAPARPRDFVQSLERGLAIIKVFNADRPALTVTEIAEATGLTRAAARRFLLTLVELGYVTTDGRFYELTPRVLELGYAFLSGLSFPEVALPRVEALVAEVREGSEAAILDGNEIVYVVRVPGPALMTIAVNIGARMPAYATALGRVLLAGLPDERVAALLEEVEPVALLPRTIIDRGALREEVRKVREQGWALVDQELEEGLVAIAAPVRDRTGRVVAAINLSTHVGRKTAKELTELLPALQAAATEIERDLAIGPGKPGRPTSMRTRGRSNGGIA